MYLVFEDDIWDKVRADIKIKIIILESKYIEKK